MSALTQVSDYQGAKVHAPEQQDICAAQIKTIQRIEGWLQSQMHIDSFRTCNIDFTTFPFNQKKEIKALKPFLCQLLQNSRDWHLISLKIPPKCARISTYAQKLGFQFHHANGQEIQMTYCCRHHSADECTYPKFMTASVGVTGVVIDRHFENVLLVQEKWGGLRAKKPPTGGVDYLEKNEDPLDAVVREVEEETGVKLRTCDAVLVASTWTQQLRNGHPDINFVYAFIGEMDAPLQAQEEEVSSVGWSPIDDYLSDGKDSHYVMREIVIAARAALQQRSQWTPRLLQWNNGLPVTLYSNSSGGFYGS